MTNHMECMSSLKLFDEMLQNPGKDFKDQLVPQKQNQQQLQRVKKNIVLVYPSDSAGCGHIRAIFPFSYINSVFAKSGTLIPAMLPFYEFQPNILVRARTLYFQRQMDPRQLEVIKQYKSLQPKFQYKMVWDLDDFIYKGEDVGECVPEYNFGSIKVTETISKTSLEIMSLMDLITVSTQFLADYLKNKQGVTVPIKVVPNSVLLSYWGTKKREPIKEKIDKPRIIATGSPTHWSDAKKLRGDWENSFVEYILKAVTDNKIDFFMMGAPQNNVAPFFFKSLEGRANAKFMGWVGSMQYALPVKDYGAHFSVGPLVPNYFNYSKSNLKYLEAAASGSAFIGTVFTNGKPSPYDLCQLKVNSDCSVKDIADLVEYNSYPENFNKVIKDQYKWLEDVGGYLESPKFISQFVSIL